MFDLNSNLVKEPLTRQLKAKFEYRHEGEGEAAQETSRKTQRITAPAPESARRPFWTALWRGKQVNS